MIAFAAPNPGVPAGPGPYGQYTPYGQTPNVPGMPQGNYGPRGLEQFGPNSPLVPGFDPNQLPRDYRADYPQDERGRDDRTRERDVREDYPIPGFEPGTRQGGGSPQGLTPFAAIDSDDICTLHEATNTVSARGDCISPRSCIVQERPQNSETRWRDSTGNPTPRQRNLEYRAFCR